MNVYHITYSPDTNTVCLFFLGCNFSCKGCIRKRTEGRDVYLKTTNTKKPKKHLRVKKILSYINSLKIERVIFLGGEPTIDPEFNTLARILRYDYGTYNVLITNGHLLADLAGINEICLSIKAITPEVHQEFTGMSNKDVLLNFKYLSRINNIQLRAESIFIPGYIDLLEIERIAKFIASCNSNIPYRIDGYITVADFPLTTPKEEELIACVNIASNYLQNVTYLCQDTKLKYAVKEII